MVVAELPFYIKLTNQQSVKITSTLPFSILKPIRAGILKFPLTRGCKK
jgi:hypothetical protein